MHQEEKIETKQQVKIERNPFIPITKGIDVEKEIYAKLGTTKKQDWQKFEKSIKKNFPPGWVGPNADFFDSMDGSHAAMAKSVVEAAMENDAVQQFEICKFTTTKITLPTDCLSGSTSTTKRTTSKKGRKQRKSRKKGRSS